MSRLDSFKSTTNTTPTTPTKTAHHHHHHHQHHHHPPCTACGYISAEPLGSMKRSSPSDPNPNPDPLGYYKISLPPFTVFNQLPKPTQPLLRRCVSDPYNPPQSPDHHHPNKASFINAVPFQPSPPKPSSNSTLLPPLPPQPTLRRTVSDLNPSPAKSSSRSSSPSYLSSDFETPDSKRLRRMECCLREMSLWCKKLVSEDEESEQEEEQQEVQQEEEQQEEEQQEEQQQEEEDQEVEEEEEEENGATDQDIHHDNAATQVNCEREFVNVEKKDDSLVIHFRCHCDKAYQFLLNGGDCYYKIM